MPPVNAANEEMNKIRPTPRSRMEGTARWASRERGTQVHCQHLVELGGGDVLQRLDAAQPGVADQHIHRTQRFGDAWTSSPGACGRRRSAPTAIALPPAEVISAASTSAARPLAP
jgi:hypothetical protein